MSNIIDLDVYGSETSSGDATVLYGDEALDNAIIAFLTSKKTDYVNRPEIGGLIESLLFKPLSQDTGIVSTRIKSELRGSFENFVAPLLVSIVPDYENYLWDITVVYLSLLTKEKRATTISLRNFTGTVRNTEPRISVTESDDNLVNMVLLNKSYYPNDKLVYDGNLNKWTWGKYILENLEAGSDTFTQILTVLNT